MNLAATAGLQATVSLIAEIEHLAQIASVVLNQHINQEGAGSNGHRDTPIRSYRCVE